MIDTHCHLYLEEFDQDREEVVKRSLDAGVNKIILPNIDSGTVLKMSTLSKEYPNIIYNTLGLHPTSVKENYLKELEEVFSNDLNIVGIGETGIDLYWDKTFFKEQQLAFDYQLNLACERKLPIIIHSRNSLVEVMDIIINYKNKGLTGVFHCYPGDLQNAKTIVDYGLYIGIGGVVTYKNNNMTDVVAGIPAEYILTETDSPYLTPVPYRGKRNEPAYIRQIVDAIALIQGVNPDYIAKTTEKNSKILFCLE
jgi:TatD DNase family protein